MRRPSTPRCQHQRVPEGFNAASPRVVLIALAGMVGIFNVFILDPQQGVGTSSSHHLLSFNVERRQIQVSSDNQQSSDDDESTDARVKRALLYQLKPAQQRSEHEVNLTQQECGYHSDSYSKFFQQTEQVRSSSNEDKTIYTTFFKNLHPEDMKHMTYVELGGYDGKTESNSRFFDVCLGWKGLLIEANPTAFSELVKNRPHAHRLSFAPSCTLQEEARNKTIGFLSTPKAWANAAQVDTPNADSYNDIEPIQVPCGSLTPVLLDYFPPDGHVTFFSLDVEGAEALVVQNIDFDKVMIEILIVENVNAHCKRNEPCESRQLTRERMKEAGYSLVTDFVSRSDLYIHPKSRFLSLARNTEAAKKTTAMAQKMAIVESSGKRAAAPLNKAVAHGARNESNHAVTSSIIRSSSAGYKRALYQHEPAKARTEADIHAARNECGNHTGLYSKFFQQTKEFRSSSYEDNAIYTTFFKSLLPEEMKDMTYVELGGFDGRTESNSRFFDVCLGWKGLLIEANPTAYPSLVKNRPHAHHLSFAPSCTAEEEAANKTVGFLSTPKAWTNAAQVDTPNSVSFKEIIPIQVPCGSLTPVLLDFFPGDGHVTFFSLDVEGAEALVVQNIDFDKVFIEILIAENQNAHCRIDEPCESRSLTRERMKEAGYSLFENVVKRSDLYIHPKSRFLVEMNQATMSQ